jgi:hypothetical protein
MTVGGNERAGERLRARPFGLSSQAFRRLAASKRPDIASQETGEGEGLEPA